MGGGEACAFEMAFETQALCVHKTSISVLFGSLSCWVCLLSGAYKAVTLYDSRQAARATNFSLEVALFCVLECSIAGQNVKCSVCRVTSLVKGWLTNCCYFIIGPLLRERGRKIKELRTYFAHLSSFLPQWENTSVGWGKAPSCWGSSLRAQSVSPFWERVQDGLEVEARWWWQTQVPWLPFMPRTASQNSQLKPRLLLPANPTWIPTFFPYGVHFGWPWYAAKIDAWVTMTSFPHRRHQQGAGIWKGNASPLSP